MKLCILSSSYCIGGLEKLLHSLCCRLDPSQFNITALLLAGHGRFVDLMQTQTKAQVHVFNIPSPLRLLEAKRALSVLRDLDPDLIHSFGLKGDVLSRVFGHGRRRPVLVSTVANPDLTHRTLTRVVNAFSARWVSAFWADCRARARLGEERLGIPADRIRVLYPGVELPDPDRVHGESASLRERLEIPQQAPILAVVGDLRVIKGHLQIVDAAPRILERFPDAVFLFLGDDASAGALRARVMASPASSQLRLLGFCPDPQPYLQAADLLLQPSLSEGLPRAALEAMVLGKAVVASRVGGIPEIIEDGKCGTLIAPGNAAALAEATIDLLSDPQRARRLGERGRKAAQTRFRLEDTIRRFEELYRELAG